MRQMRKNTNLSVYLLCTTQTFFYLPHYFPSYKRIIHWWLRDLKEPRSTPSVVLMLAHWDRVGYLIRILNNEQRLTDHKNYHRRPSTKKKQSHYLPIICLLFIASWYTVIYGPFNRMIIVRLSINKTYLDTAFIRKHFRRFCKMKTILALYLEL